MNTQAINSCPKCHEPIPPEAPQGLCPKCLLTTASMATEAGQSAEAAALPSLETIAAGFPHLEILEFIGQGGMGMVFKARQTKLERFVALKLLPQKPGADPAFCERFNREARVLARLSHPNIVAVHDFGEAGPFFYLLMEFVDGVNLRQAMKAGRFTSAQALALVPKICDALQYAHEEGVLHRDIKPENLLLDTRGRVKIADFGIAKLLGDAKDITLTARGAAIGTPHYMAPEQLERPQDVDQRADVYSLGVVFYEMLTGELPIGRFAPPSEKAPMDPRVDQVVLRALEKERDRRFQSAGDVKTQVEKITTSSGAAQSSSSGSAKFAVGDEPQPPPFLPGAVDEPAPARSGWSIRAFAAAGLVGFSFLVIGLAVIAGTHIGPAETAFLSALVGMPALAGTLLAWFTLGGFKSGLNQGRGGRLTLLCAVAWPLVLLDLGLLFILLFSAETFQWHVFHARQGGLTGLVLVVGALVLLGLDVWIVRRWLGRWRSEQALPQADLRALLRRWSRPALWLSGFALVVFSLILFASHRQIRRMDEPAQILAVQEPSAPPGYEVAPGGSPGNDGRVYRSSVVIPPGYMLTVTTLLWSNQTAVKPSGTATLMASEGSPVQGQLAWRLLGNTTFADGAPLQLILSPVQGSDHSDNALHISPPEPVTIDWVGEPAAVWPPQNGHTKFLLVKGVSANQFPAEWAVGIEVRLDPLSAEVHRRLKSAVVNLGANQFPPESASEVPPEKVAEYKTICGLLQTLSSRERELLVQFTPENAWVKGVREEIAANQKIKEQLEGNNPGIATVHTPQTQDQAPGN